MALTLVSGDKFRRVYRMDYTINTSLEGKIT